ncbi:MAG TPA: DUF222 domain-containing protein [Actinomycetales bacterium]|nr:DUF222 domain-containing protein [Actinomycetales bacterium]
MAIAAEVEGIAEEAPSPSTLRPEVAAALAAEPGPALLTGVLDLMGGAGGLSPREQLELVAAWDRLVGYCQAGRLTAVQDLDEALHPDVADMESVPLRKTANELAPVLRIAPRAASALVGHARRTRNLPAAVDGLADGRLTAAQLDVLDQVTRDLPERLRGKVEAEAIQCGPTTTRQQLHGHLASKAAELDPEHVSKAVERGTGERDVQLRPSPLPGCHRLVADLPTMNAFAVWHALNGVAQRAKTAAGRAEDVTEERGIAALRADALIALVTGQADDQNPELKPASEILTRFAQVQVVVAADTLTGESDLPAHLPGAGPVDPQTVRGLATKVPWRRLVADPDTGLLMHRDTVLMTPLNGEEGLDPRLGRLTEAPVVTRPLDYGASRYRPPKHLRDHVHTRDATCIGPACHHPATGTQIDHTTNFNEVDHKGTLGVTADYNLGSPCIRWHNSKTHLGWRLEQPAPGHFIWRSPLGRTYTRFARPLVPGWQGRRERPPPQEQTGRAERAT